MKNCSCHCQGSGGQHAAPHCFCAGLKQDTSGYMPSLASGHMPVLTSKELSDVKRALTRIASTGKILTVYCIAISLTYIFCFLERYKSFYERKKKKNSYCILIIYYDYNLYFIIIIIYIIIFLLYFYYINYSNYLKIHNTIIYHSLKCY